MRWFKALAQNSDNSSSSKNQQNLINKTITKD